MFFSHFFHIQINPKHMRVTSVIVATLTLPDATLVSNEIYDLVLAKQDSGICPSVDLVSDSF